MVVVALRSATGGGQNYEKTTRPPGFTLGMCNRSIVAFSVPAQFVEHLAPYREDRSCYSHEKFLRHSAVGVSRQIYIRVISGEQVVPNCADRCVARWREPRKRLSGA